MPQGTPSLSLHPSGALLYQGGNADVANFGIPGTPGRVEIDDLHLFLPAATVVFPDGGLLGYPILSSTETDHLFTIDPTGKYLFAVTGSGITMMTLNSVPLSLGNAQPQSIQPAAGQTLTLRGSGFLPGTTVALAGNPATATYVDPDTLTVQTPALNGDWQDVTVALPSGVSYAAPGLLQVLGPSNSPQVAISLASGASATATVTTGNTATYSLVVSDGGNGYVGTAALACSGAPAKAPCTVSPAQISIGTSAVPFTVTVSTTAPQSASVRALHSGSLKWPLSLVCGALITVGRKNLYRIRLALLLVCIATVTVSCGGASGGSGGGTTPQPVPGTPSGTLNLIVTGTSNGAQTTLGLTLNVH